jgi:environmental stress-induced protein Ves
MKHLKIHDYQQMPWKNGKGTTLQIGIFPAEVDFSRSNFIWRVSSAPVLGPGSFSQFPGYERVLMIVKGAGLIMNGKKRLPFKPILFSGDEIMHAKLLEGIVVDLGVIYDAKRVRAEMKLLDIEAGEIVKLDFDGGTRFLYCAEGAAEIGGIHLLPGETCRIDGEMKTHAKAAEASKVIVIGLKMINQFEK